MDKSEEKENKGNWKHLVWLVSYCIPEPIRNVVGSLKINLLVFLRQTLLKKVYGERKNVNKSEEKKITINRKMNLIFTTKILLNIRVIVIEITSYH